MNKRDKSNPKQHATPRRSPEPPGFSPPDNRPESWKGLLPPLPAGEYDNLRESIRCHGVRVQIIVDQNGETIDGHHRQRACDDLDMYCPREVREFASDMERIQTALMLNMNRRHLTRCQKRQLIEKYLKVDPAINDTHLGEIVGCSKNTVASVRGELEGTGQIPRIEHRRGRDGKERPAKYRRIMASTAADEKRALKAIRNLPESNRILDATSAARRARLQAARNAKEVAGKAVAPLPADAIRLYHCKFQDLEEMAGIEPGSVPLVCTDFPYITEFLPELEALAEFAERVLVPGGLLVTYSGKFYLDTVMARLGERLKYRWMIATLWTGAGNLVHPLKVLSRWKPILVYSKGDWPATGGWSDVMRYNQKEKGWHDWQQPLVEVEALIEMFTKPGDLVVDPCGGGFTTAVACRNLGRRFVGCDIEEKCVLLGQERLASTPCTPADSKE